MSEQALPGRPDADQLRRMAKELRAAARAGDPDAIQRLRNHVDADPATVSLSAAQLAVAREHGFASWPRLMEHVEARRRGLPPFGGLPPTRAVAASALNDGQAIVLGGRVTSVAPDTPGGGRLRLTVVPVIAAAPGEAPDQREIALTGRGDARVRAARRVPPGERLDGPGLTSGPDRFAVEGTIGVERVKPGQVILTAGTVTAPQAEGEHGERVRFTLRNENWDEFLVVCPGDMRVATARRGEPRGLVGDKTLTADRLVSGQIVTLDGYIMSADSDPADPGRVRLVLARALGLTPDERPDQRDIVLTCPRDMMFETGLPHNIELTPPPPR
ncbi:MAG TPA: hypothetical protein VMG13_15155 [Trebonia sp.]|nr:hypothetical protein [Trebonia sp.]